MYNYTDFYSQFTENNKNLMKPFSELGNITIKTAENLTKQQMAVANDLIGLSIKHAQDLATTKKLEDLVSLNTNFFTESTNKYADFYNQLLETTLKASTEFTKLFEQSFKGVSEEIGRKAKAAA